MSNILEQYTFNFADEKSPWDMELTADEETILEELMMESIFAELDKLIMEIKQK